MGNTQNGCIHPNASTAYDPRQRRSSSLSNPPTPSTSPAPRLATAAAPRDSAGLGPNSLTTTKHGNEDDDDLDMSPAARDPTDWILLRVDELAGVPRRWDAIDALNVAKNGWYVDVLADWDNGPTQPVVRTQTVSFARGVGGAVLDDDQPLRFDASSSTAWISKACLQVRVRVNASYAETLGGGVYRTIGEAKITPKELAQRQNWTLWMFDSDEALVIGTDSENNQKRKAVLRVVVSVLNAPTPPPQNHVTLAKKATKHVMVFTRGTRGDVQPFVALARGLANSYGWIVSIVTEARYRELVEKNARVDQGEVRFLPSGGDTEKRIDWPIAKWAVYQTSQFFQYVMLARAEREFFDSEPAFFYWAESMRPDVILFTFVTASVSMIVSESLQIPLVGLILQPTVIPSKEYPAVVPIGGVGAYLRKEAALDEVRAA